MKRAFNFNAGPSAMPLEVLQEAQAEFLNYADTGMSIIEMSHRSADYASIGAFRGFRRASAQHYSGPIRRGVFKRG